MTKNIQSIRGMHDFAPDECRVMRTLENILIGVLRVHGYQEVRTPIVEPLDLFKRSIGELTDIVEKEMYAFEDRGGDWLALRPEGTASVVRAGIQHGWLHNQQQRFWYVGPYFRRERPQKGRYRQFHQLGVETFGFEGPDIDVELILLSDRFWSAMDLDRTPLELQINSLGDAQTRAAYRKILIEYFSAHQDQLDEDASNRLHSNPLRILDSKNPHMQALVANAPLLSDHLNTESSEHFHQLRERLDELQVSYRVNSHLVRGLDYYNRTVFEWVSTDLGAQGTICAGGRYDDLVAQLGGRATAAAGFAVGLERLSSIVTAQLDAANEPLDAYFVAVGEDEARHAMKIVEQIRDQLPGYAVQMNCGGGSIKSQMKRADRSGARLALIIGKDEYSKQQVSIKNLQADIGQKTIPENILMEQLERERRSNK